jgi:hypothetical protein
MHRDGNPNYRIDGGILHIPPAMAMMNGSFFRTRN